MSGVWVLGSVTWDWVVRVDSLPAHGYSTNGVSRGGRPGGGAANVARALASAGLDVHFVGIVGRDRIGDALVNDLKWWGVDVSHVQRSASGNARTIVLIDGMGEKSIVALDSIQFKLDRIPVEDVRTADAVFFDGYHPELAFLVRDLSSRVPLIVSGMPHSQASPWPVNVVVGSRFDYPPAWHRYLHSRVSSFLGHPPDVVLMTRGSRGAVAFLPDRKVSVPSTRVRQVDTTGAGDSFAAGVLYAMIKRYDMNDVLKLGVKWGASTVTVDSSTPVNFNPRLLSEFG